MLKKLGFCPPTPSLIGLIVSMDLILEREAKLRSEKDVDDGSWKIKMFHTITR